MSTGNDEEDRQRPQIEEAGLSTICRQCRQNYRPPIKILPCDHSFCFQCLIDWYQEMGRTRLNEITCPTCHIRITFHRGLRALPNNVKLEQWARKLGVLGEPHPEADLSPRSTSSTELSESVFRAPPVPVDLLSEQAIQHIRIAFDNGACNVPLTKNMRIGSHMCTVAVIAVRAPVQPDQQVDAHATKFPRTNGTQRRGTPIREPYRPMATTVRPALLPSWRP